MTFKPLTKQPTPGFKPLEEQPEIRETKTLPSGKEAPFQISKATPRPPKAHPIIQEMFEPFAKAGVTVKRTAEATFQLTQALTAKAVGNDEAYQRNLKQANEALTLEEADFGVLGKVKPLDHSASTEDQIKEAVGVGLEIGAWMVPGAPKGSGALTRGTTYFGRGFAFGAGDTLGDGGTVEEALESGLWSGTMNVALGMAADKLITTTAPPQRVDKAKHWIKVGESLKQTVKEADDFVAESLGTTTGKMAMDRTKNKAIETVKKTVDETLGGTQLKNIGIFGLFAGPEWGVGALQLHYGYKGIKLLTKLYKTYGAVASDKGQIALRDLLERGIVTLNKMDPEVRNKVAERFINNLISQWAEGVKDSFEVEETSFRPLEVQPAQ